MLTDTEQEDWSTNSHPNLQPLYIEDGGESFDPPYLISYLTRSTPLHTYLLPHSLKHANIPRFAIPTYLSKSPTRRGASRFKHPTL